MPSQSTPPPHRWDRELPEMCSLSARALASAYAQGALSPVEVVRAALQRAQDINPHLNAFSAFDAEGAMAAAQQAEARWRAGRPLSAIDGVPATLKDIVHVKGWSVRYGSHVTPSAPCTHDAPSVACLRAAGVVFIGQTTTPEFGWKAVTDSPAFGITRAPWSPACTPGGSSGGAAVAAAVGAGVLHLGTDGGGSIRIPAAFTGTAGLKPTFGRVAASPPSVFGTVAHIGPMACRVDDLALMLDAMSGADPRDWLQGAGTLPALEPATALLDGDAALLRGLRVGLWTEPAGGRVEPAIAAHAATLWPRLERAGALIEPVHLGGAELLEIFELHWFSGAAHRIALVAPEQRPLIDAGLREAAELGHRADAAALAGAQARRAAFGEYMQTLLTKHDVLISPAVAVAPFGAGLEVPEGSGLERWTRWAGFSFPINLSQQPACVVPAGELPSGAPVGVQIVAARGAESRLLRVAAAVERLLAAGRA